MKTILRLLIVCFLFTVSCTVTKPVKTGEMAYEFKQFVLAAELLEKEYRESSNDNDKARKARYLAKSNDVLENYGEALKWYDAADQLYQTENSMMELAYSLKINERYGDASKLFNDLYSRTRDVAFRKENQICTIAAKAVDEIDNYKLESFQVNTSSAEYSPCFYEDDFLIFSSDRPSSTGSKEYKWNNRSFSDLWVTDFKGRQSHNFDAIINSEHNEGSVCFSKDFKEIFFTRCSSTETRDQHCKLFYSQKPNGFWIEPEALMFYDDQTNFAHPCLIENDSVLIFTAKPPGTDNYDLFYSVRVGQVWTEAEIMPSNINTEGDEKFPTSHGDSLFFASDGHLGYGGLDIFMTVLQENGSWSDPQNMSWPINGGADDFGLIIRNNSKGNSSIEMQGIFSSSRNTGFASDLFSFTKFKIEEVDETIEEIAQEEEKGEQEYLVYLSVSVYENIHENDDPNAKVTERNPVKEGRAELTFSDENRSLDLNAQGKLIYRVESDDLHNLQIKTKQHLSRKITIEIPDFESITSDTTVNVEINLDRIVYDKEIVISNIYYNFDEWNIRNDAEAPLDSLAELLSLNNHLNIELASHTDCRGEEEYNLDLSQKRAQSVVDYLVNKDLEKERFTAVGYGESKRTIDCICNDCTEEEHQANRRTSFKILKPE